MSDVANMLCPNCGHFQSAVETCQSCGVVMGKVTRAHSAPATRPANAAPAEAASAVASLIMDEASDAEPSELSGRVKVALAAAGLLLVAGLYLLFTPKPMSIEEFVEAKKASFHLRGFSIEGMAEPYSDSYLVTQSSDGKTMSSLKIVADDVEGIVTYHPDELAHVPRKGEYVRVRGSFESVPYYGMPGEFRRMTLAHATSITLLSAAQE